MLERERTNFLRVLVIMGPDLSAIIPALSASHSSAVCPCFQQILKRWRQLIR